MESRKTDGPCKVLIADDNPINAKLMAQICKAFGWEYDIVDGGDECLRALDDSANSYDAVLMDIHMPGKSGIETAIEIRKHRDDPPRNIRIIALTADASSENKRKCAAAGMNGFITKPIDVLELKTIVESA